MKVEPLGCLIGECSLPGERRADDVFPAHPNGLQASRHTWLLLYATRGWRAVDDDRSIVYQLRRGAPDGELVREGVLAAATDDWDATGDGTPYVRQHGHPVLFGLPKGAVIDGREPVHAGLFVAKWRIKAMGRFDPATGTVSRDHDLWERTQGVQWAQFRLNDREDDIVIVQPAAELRQEGHGHGAAVLRGKRPLDEPDLHTGRPIRGRRQPVGGRQSLRRRPGGGAALPVRRRRGCLPLERHRSTGRRPRPVAALRSLGRAFR